MKKPKLKTLLLTPVALLVLAYLAIAILVATRENVAPEFDGQAASLETIAIFGASGTAGDGILQAALSNPEISTIHVITRRSTPRIEAGIASGKIQMTKHMDYMDYTEVREQVADADAVFWAIGTSSVGMDEDTYRKIHIDFPVAFVQAWMQTSTKPRPGFHYISSSDISEDASAMWARVKFEAEKTLIEQVKDSKLRVICYRPDYIGPTEEEAHLGQKFLYWFFSPLGVAVKAIQIGQAMMEVSLRGDEFGNGHKLGNWSIIRYSDAYEKRQ